jgi:hypothetical protein
MEDGAVGSGESGRHDPAHLGEWHWTIVYFGDRAICMVRGLGRNWPPQKSFQCDRPDIEAIVPALRVRSRAASPALDGFLFVQEKKTRIPTTSSASLGLPRIRRRAPGCDAPLAPRALFPVSRQDRLARFPNQALIATRLQYLDGPCWQRIERLWMAGVVTQEPTWLNFQDGERPP